MNTNIEEINFNGYNDLLQEKLAHEPEPCAYYHVSQLLSFIMEKRKSSEFKEANLDSIIDVLYRENKLLWLLEEPDLTQTPQFKNLGEMLSAWHQIEPFEHNDINLAIEMYAHLVGERDARIGRRQFIRYVSYGVGGIIALIAGFGVDKKLSDKLKNPQSSIQPIKRDTNEQGKVQLPSTTSLKDLLGYEPVNINYEEQIKFIEKFGYSTWDIDRAMDGIVNFDLSARYADQLDDTRIVARRSGSFYNTLYIIKRNPTVSQIYGVYIYSIDYSEPLSIDYFLKKAGQMAYYRFNGENAVTVAYNLSGKPNVTTVFNYQGNDVWETVSRKELDKTSQEYKHGWNVLQQFKYLYTDSEIRTLYADPYSHRRTDFKLHFKK